MKSTAGVWIDHRKAVISIVSVDEEKTLEIRSDIEERPGRFTGVRSPATFDSQLVPADDSRKRKPSGKLRDYYDSVLAAIVDSESMLFFGPGEAKGELKKRFESLNPRKHIITVETTDTMTDRQVTANVHAYFPQYRAMQVPPGGADKSLKNRRYPVKVDPRAAKAVLPVAAQSVKP